MKALARSLLLWIVLAGISYLLAQIAVETTPLPVAIGAMVVLPTLAVALTAWAIAALPYRVPVRIGFWVLTSAAWLTLLYFVEAREILPLVLSLVALNTALFAARLHRLPSSRTVVEAASGAFLLVLAISAFGWWYDAKSRDLVSHAKARWTEIGLPMAEFEKTIAVTRENASSEVFRQILRERIGSKFYKDTCRAGEREPAIVPSKASEELVKQAADVLSAKLPPSDVIDLSSTPQTAMEAQAESLDADYRRLLATEPPIWASDLHDAYVIDVPNFLGVRKFSQVAAADALRRISIGDQEGARRAIAAGMQLRTGLRQNPSLVSLMIDVAVEALLSTKNVRLPCSEDALPLIAADSASLRAEFVYRMQVEAWGAMQMANQTMDAEPAGHILHKWLNRVYGLPQFRSYVADGVLNSANYVAILKSPSTLVLPDLGTQQYSAISTANPSILATNPARSAMRIEATLLLQEQVELIRQARARLAAGQPVESRTSVVLPHLRWELIANAEKNAVATRLVDAPEWIVEKTITGDGFWVIPIDGSVAWQFRTPSPTTSQP